MSWQASLQQPVSRATGCRSQSPSSYLGDVLLDGEAFRQNSKDRKKDHHVEGLEGNREREEEMGRRSGKDWLSSLTSPGLQAGSVIMQFTHMVICNSEVLLCCPVFFLRFVLDLIPRGKRNIAKSPWTEIAPKSLFLDTGKMLKCPEFFVIQHCIFKLSY